MNEKVIAREEVITIPTYPESSKEELPMFAENRVHQRSTGNPYPNKVIIKTREKNKIDKQYNAIRLENKYIELIILPEIGGRIFSAKDKTTGYDFFYRQHVIKPALIGALGSWISGGVEFNWPYHHRPSTFMPVDYEIVREADGGATVWLSEHDPIDRMKGMVGIHLSPDSTVFETRMKVTNRTPLRHSFLWWENTAVPVNPDYEIFFPPDVDHVHFHYRRSNTTFPIANGMFNGFRFKEGGVDIRKHFNTKNSTSYFCAGSRYDFFGGYDNGKQCGVVHVADHQTSTGKKMFTWAYNQLSQSWERALTDTDGAYAELMAGSYSNNQPDFSWLEPYETKCFSQFWYPITKIGVPSYANLKAAVNVKSGVLKIEATTDIKNKKLSLSAGGKVIFEKTISLGAAETTELEIPALDENNYEITIEGVLDFKKTPLVQKPLPPLFDGVPMPDEMPTAEKRYLSGVHYMQFRDPNANPENYFKAALEIDPAHVPSLTALGELYCGRNDFRSAYEKLIAARTNANLYCTNQSSGKLNYLLGYAEERLGMLDDAYDSYRKAAWNEDAISAAMTRASAVDGREDRYDAMLFCAENALVHNGVNYYAGPLAALAERELGENKKAEARIEKILEFDPLNHLARYVAWSLGKMSEKDFFAKLHSNISQTCLDVAFDLKAAGFDGDASKIIDAVCKYTDDVAPAIAYMTGKPELLNKKHPAFPSRIEEIEILEAHKDDKYAKYLLGCAYYNNRRYEDAYKLWLDCEGYEAKRCIAVYLWRQGKHDEALRYLDEALALAPDCEQLIYEKAYLLNKLGTDAAKTAKSIEGMVRDLAAARDDICTEWAAAANRAGQYEEALRIINNHIFIPCEGGETVVAKQHLNAYYGIGRRQYEAGEYEKAIESFRTAQVIPDNLGAGLWHVCPLVPSQYSEAMSLKKLGKTEEANKIFNYIAGIYVDYFSNMHLPELPVYQAMSLIQLGDGKGAEEVLARFKAAWEAERERRDSGYFATTPFFISYMDDPTSERHAYYDRLINMAVSVIEKNNILLK